MKKINIAELSLNTPVYHANFGKGQLMVITQSELAVSFNGADNMKFESAGTVGNTRFIDEELFLEPVSIQPATCNQKLQ